MGWRFQKVLLLAYNDLFIDSLTGLIHFQRPDLLQSHLSQSIIPLNPPVDFFPGISPGLLFANLSTEYQIPGIGELMLASFPPGGFLKAELENSW